MVVQVCGLPHGALTCISSSGDSDDYSKDDMHWRRCNRGITDQATHLQLLVSEKGLEAVHDGGAGVRGGEPLGEGRLWLLGQRQGQVQAGLIGSRHRHALVAGDGATCEARKDVVDGRVVDRLSPAPHPHRLYALVLVQRHRFLRQLSARWPGPVLQQEVETENQI